MQHVPSSLGTQKEKGYEEQEEKNNEKMRKKNHKAPGEREIVSPRDLVRDAEGGGGGGRTSRGRRRTTKWWEKGKW